MITGPFKLPSKYQIGDDVELLIPAEDIRDSESMITSAELIDYDDITIFGTVIGVRFTRAKVFYDILDLSNEILKDVDSAYCVQEVPPTTAQA